MPPIPAAGAMTTLLARPSPALGVFWPAGWPTLTGGIDILRALVDAGAEWVEVGAGTSQGALADAITTVNGLAKCRMPVAVRAYWEVLARVGPVGAAAALAKAGTGGVIVPDLPEAQVAMWASAARWSGGMHTPRIAFRRVTDSRLAAVCRAASGWVVTSAVDTARTGVPGGPDLPGLRDFVPRIRAVTDLPVVVGAGRSSVARAVQISRIADAVLVGSALIQRVQATPGPDGRAHAAAYVRDLGSAMRAERAALPAQAGADRARPAVGQRPGR